MRRPELLPINRSFAGYMMIHTTLKTKQEMVPLLEQEQLTALNRRKLKTHRNVSAWRQLFERLIRMFLVRWYAQWNRIALYRCSPVRDCTALHYTTLHCPGLHWNTRRQALRGGCKWRCSNAYLHSSHFPRVEERGITSCPRRDCSKKSTVQYISVQYSTVQYMT